MAAVGVTGQSPKRRETEAEALKRARILSVRASECQDAVLLARVSGTPKTRELARWNLGRARGGKRS